MGIPLACPKPPRRARLWRWLSNQKRYDPSTDSASRSRLRCWIWYVTRRKQLVVIVETFLQAHCNLVMCCQRQQKLLIFCLHIFNFDFSVSFCGLLFFFLQYHRARYTSEGTRGAMRGRGSDSFPTVKVSGSPSQKENEKVHGCPWGRRFRQCPHQPTAGWNQRAKIRRSAILLFFFFLIFSCFFYFFFIETPNLFINLHFLCSFVIFFPSSFWLFFPPLVDSTTYLVWAKLHGLKRQRDLSVYLMYIILAQFHSRFFWCTRVEPVSRRRWFIFLLPRARDSEARMYYPGVSLFAWCTHVEPVSRRRWFFFSRPRARDPEATIAFQRRHISIFFPLCLCVHSSMAPDCWLHWLGCCGCLSCNRWGISSWQHSRSWHKILAGRRSGAAK